MAMIAGIHHAQITIPSGKEEKARAFYCGLLGLKDMDKPESLKGRGGFWIRLGNADLHIGTEEGVDRSQTKAHIAYEVNDMKYWKEHLEKHGINILPSIPIPGYDRFECRDPFGNRVEMIQAL
ncbi:catechol 2,3-dioxygenase-like lactoylglutathione lyase family enzyme [Rossellomorea marisflavi]